jgi:ankyrin repeat protein
MDANQQKRLQKMLWSAAAAGDCAMVRKLAMAGVDFDARDEDGFSAFNIATMKGRVQTARTILAVKDFVSIPQPSGARSAA